MLKVCLIVLVLGSSGVARAEAVTAEIVEESGAMEAAVRQIHSVLPKYHAERDIEKYEHLRDTGKFRGSFQSYLVQRFYKQRNAGIVMTSLAGAFTVGTAAFAVVLASGPDCEYPEQDSCYISGAEGTMITLTVVFAAAAAVLYSVGIPKLLIGKSRADKVKQLDGTGSARRLGIEDLRLSILQDPQRGAVGFAAGFSF